VYSGGGGGGGLGAGGDIFVQQGGGLSILDSSLGAGTVQGGAGGGGFAGAGQALGGALFVQGAANLTFAPGAGQSLTIGGAIADTSGGALTIGGSGQVVFNGQAGFNQPITIAAGGRLDIQSAPDAVTGPIADDGALIFATTSAYAGDVLQDPAQETLPGAMITVDGQFNLPASNFSVANQALQTEYNQAYNDLVQTGQIILPVLYAQYYNGAQSFDPNPSLSITDEYAPIWCCRTPMLSRWRPSG
jgi:hypothetical protein